MGCPSAWSSTQASSRGGSTDEGRAADKFVTIGEEGVVDGSAGATREEGGKSGTITIRVADTKLRRSSLDPGGSHRATRTRARSRSRREGMRTENIMDRGRTVRFGTLDRGGACFCVVTKKHSRTISDALSLSEKRFIESPSNHAPSRLLQHI